MLVALGLSATACQISDPFVESLAVKHVVFTALPFEEDAVTKTNINVVDGKNKFAWSANDTVGIYPNSGSQIYFVVDAEEGAGTASFDGGGWEFKLGAVYRSYYPFIGDFYLNPRAIPVSYTGQKQTGNDNTNHMGPYDFMYTPAVSSENGNLRFSYKHLSSILRPVIDLPAGRYTQLTLSVDSPLFVVSGVFDLAAGSPSIEGKSFTRDFSIDLDITLSEGEQMVVSLMSAPVDLRGKTLTVKVWNESGKMFSYEVVPEEEYAASKIKKIISPVSFVIGSVTVDQTELSLFVDETQQLTATVLPENVANKAVTWTSSNPFVATVSEAGFVTALTPGTTTITVTTVEGGKTAACEVAVSPVSVTSVSLNKSELTLLPGDTETLSATVNPENAGNKNISWSSNNTSVATVDAAGKVTAMGVGTAIITVTTEDGGKTAECTVAVNPIAVTSVTLSQSSLSLTKGSTSTLTATVAPTNATDKTVTWSSNNTNVATVDANGKVTAVSGGSATITASAGGKSATCSVTVTVPVTGVSLNKTSTSITIGSTETLTATVTPSDATNKSVTWSSSDTNIATVSNGTVTAKAVGTATITVKTVDGNKTATCAVTVNPIAVTGITLNKTSLTFSSLNSTQQLTATVTPENATNKTVTWESSNTSVATVSSTGVVTSKGSGTATITASAGGKSATCSVTVTVPVTGVSLNKTSTSITIGSTETLTATVTPSDATNKSVTWSSSDTNIATVSNGTVTAKAVGTATITVKTVDGNKTATCAVTVNPIAVTGITLNKTSLTFSSLNSTQQLTATVTPENATNKTVTWESSNTSVATVSSSGVVTSKGSGTATITASAGGKSATCAVTVNIPVSGVSLNKTTLSLKKGSSETLAATVSPSNATNSEVIWSSSNSSVASVNSSGKVTANAVGNATITVKTVDGNKTATCNVSVTAPDLVSFTLSPSSLTMFEGDVQTVTAILNPSDAQITSTYWYIDYEIPASVVGNGLSGEVHAYSKGTTDLKVVINGIERHCSITVRDADPVAVDLGLNVYWGDRNLKALESTDFGQFYHWAEIKDYESDGWRLPTKEEMEALISNCNIVEATENGVSGFRLTSKTNHNSIFLPDAGGYNNDFGSSHLTGMQAGYWSKSSITSTSPYEIMGYRFRWVNSFEVVPQSLTSNFRYTVRLVKPK